MSVERELFQLPGVRRFVDDVRRSLERRASAVCVLPQWILTDAQWTTDFLDALEWPIDQVRDVPDERPGFALASHMEIAPVFGDDVASQLSVHPVMAGRTFCLVLEEGPTRGRHWAQFLEEFGMASKAQPAEERTCFLLLVREEHAECFAQGDVLLDKFWWWGLLTRLDIAFYLSTRGGLESPDEVRVESIIELAGFDLGVASLLWDQWDGRSDSLEALVGCSDAVVFPPVQEQRGLGPRRFAEPPAEVRAQWNAGLVDRWDRYLQFASLRGFQGQVLTDALNTRLWRAQLRELMPLVDEERSRLEGWLRELDGLKLPEGPMEIADIGRVIKYSLPHQHRNRARHEAVDWLWTTRNVLAHRGTLSTEDLDKGRRLLDQDRRS